VVKKRVISLFFLFVFAILFAHSVIPHHHHEEDPTAVHHHDHHHDDDHNDVDDNFLSHVFSFFQHDGDSTIIYDPSVASDCTKVTIDKNVAFLIQYIVEVVYKPPIVHTEQKFIFRSLSVYPTGNHFRGPPVSWA
jgi:hypothetical protein